MSLQFKPLHPVFVAEASGIDLTRPLSLDEIKQFNAGMNRYGVLVIRGQPLTGQQQIDFAQSFGPLDIDAEAGVQAPRAAGGRAADRHLQRRCEGRRRAGAIRRKNLSNFANQLWHSDSSFMKPRAAYSMLHAVVLPSWGGNTEFADLRAAYDALPERTKREIAGPRGRALRAAHAPPARRRRLHRRAEEGRSRRRSGRWSTRTRAPAARCCSSASMPAQIIGWPTAESRIFLADLLEHATQRERVYVHEWQVGDLVIWDNRATLHRGRRYDIAERRELRRTTINDTPEAMLQAA